MFAEAIRPSGALNFLPGFCEQVPHMRAGVEYVLHAQSEPGCVLPTQCFPQHIAKSEHITTRKCYLTLCPVCRCID